MSLIRGTVCGKKPLRFTEEAYRAVVVHSDAHDRQRQKRIDNAVKKDSETVRAEATALSRKEFFCLPDAQTASGSAKGRRFSPDFLFL